MNTEEQTTAPTKIERVKIDHFKCIQDFDQDLSGRSILLVGDNELGKTSVAQFIQIGIGRSELIPPNAQGNGELIITKNGRKYLLKVKIEGGKSSITITGEDNMSDSRKGTLTNLIGPVEFDIDEFVQLSKSRAGQKKQVEIFKSFLPDEIRMDLAKYESNVQVAYTERTELNRQIEDLKGSVKTNPLFSLPPKELDKFSFIDTTKVMQELQVLQTHNSKHAQVLSNFNNRAEVLKTLNSELEELKKKISETEGTQAMAGEWMKANPVKDTSELESKISNASKTNHEYEQAQDLKKKNAQISKYEEESGELTAKIESEREAIRNAIRYMEAPVEGLAFDEEKLIYNGLPVHPEVLSESQIMELGLLMKIAENPQLGVVFLERTESYGKKRWEQILDVCKRHNLQIIGERVKYGQESLTVEIIA